MITFFPHQEKAIEQLRSGSILCGGVGSGKSRTSLGYFLIKECNGDLDCEKIKSPKNLLIITTAKKRDEKEWDSECEVFGLSQNKDKSFCGIKVTIDSWNNIKKYIEFQNGFVIFDEQKVVGSGAWVKAFYKIASKNHWILLTATPGDSWMDYIPVFVANGYYKNRSSFLYEHAIYDRYSKYPRISRWLGHEKLERIRNDILVEMPFEKKTNRHEIIVSVDYNKMLYKTVVRDRWNPYDNKPIENSSELYALMRRVTNSDESRLEAIVNIFSKHKRLIIFYSFDYELEILKSLDKVLSDVKIAEWNGHNHEQVPKTDNWIYLVNYMSGAEGWECIKTNTIVFYSQQYSYRIAEQSMGRIDRLNTPYIDLYYYWLRSKAWIDVAIGRAMIQKKDFNERRHTFKF